MQDLNKKARTAGLLYLGVITTGIFSLAYVPSQLFDWKSPESTFQKISENELLFRLSIVGGLACYLFFTFLPLALRELLKGTDSKMADLMVVLALLSVPISFFNLTNKLAILPLLSNQTGRSIEQRTAEVFQFLHQYEAGIEVVLVFWGLWLLPFGILVYRSGFLPKILGVLLVAGCFGYLITVLGGLLFPTFSKTIFGQIAAMPATFGEIGSGLWLTIFGARKSFKKQVEMGVTH